MNVDFGVYWDRPDHMKTLHTVATTKIKIWKEFPNGTHNDTVSEDGYFDAITEFIIQTRKGKF